MLPVVIGVAFVDAVRVARRAVPSQRGPMEARKREDAIETAFNMSSPSWNRDREKGGKRVTDLA